MGSDEKRNGQWANRIVGMGEKPADQFMANPSNARQHPQNQRDAVRGSLNELGWVAPVVENVNTGYLLDGHERVWQALDNDNADVPFIQVDLSPEEEKLFLASFDYITTMAYYDSDILEDLLRDVQTGEAGLQQMLDELAVREGVVPPPDPWEHWQGMPEFEQEDQTSHHSIRVHFRNSEDIQEFAELVGQEISDKTRSIWYPEAEKIDMTPEYHAS